MVDKMYYTFDVAASDALKEIKKEYQNSLSPKERSKPKFQNSLSPKARQILNSTSPKSKITPRD